MENIGEAVLLENSKKNCKTFLNNFDSWNIVIELIKRGSALGDAIYNVAMDVEISFIDLL